ncbi:metal ABC transporter solute-binding protein, Zn/Mn family [Longirhabdus pacifica]|uniref:metal ABC transporter solute-binding protein, Zn/Mn family n=1 Tax=Longirhabdus pacifica TaxID=2305227 RepID=UPI001008F7D8|nr:zinc ABC transporter substrate-binding protein [Longirhabdus pacifica]
MKVKVNGWRRFGIASLFLAVMILVVAGCGSNETSDEETSGDESTTDKIKVTATIGMITDVTRHVGGDLTEVSGLMKEGTDPHLYKATPGDIKKLDNAEIIFYNGLYLEAQMAEIIEQMNSDEKPTVAVGEKLDTSKLIAADPETGGEYDPHVWFDVELWTNVTEEIRDALIAFDPDNKEEYTNNAEAYLAELQELDAYVQEQINTIPEGKRVLITAHDAFGYFGEAYGIEVRGLQGLSTASEAGSKDTVDLVNFIVDNESNAVFVETSISDEAITSVIEGAKKKGHNVVIGGSLFSDAMGAEGTEEGTYIGMVRHNVDTIVSALK